MYSPAGANKQRTLNPENEPNTGSTTADWFDPESESQQQQQHQLNDTMRQPKNLQKQQLPPRSKGSPSLTAQ